MANQRFARFMNQAESFLYFGPSKLGLENLAILHTRSVNFVVANPIGLSMANRWFARFTAQAEIVFNFYLQGSAADIMNLAMIVSISS